MQDGAPKNYYGVTFSSNGCNFEILVNDVPVYRFFKEGGVTSFYPINPWILSSGEQRLKVRLYPVKGFEDKGILSSEPLNVVVKYLPDPAVDLNEATVVIADFIPLNPVLLILSMRLRSMRKYPTVQKDGRMAWI